MSDTAVLEAPPEQRTIDAPAAPQSTPAGALLGIQPQSTPAPTESSQVPSPVNPGPSAEQAIESPYFARLVADNPDLKQYESTLAHFSKPTTAEALAAETAKGYAEAVKFKGILVPGAEAADKDIATYRKVNGLPAEAKDYKLTEATEKRMEAMGLTSPEHKAIYAEAAHKAYATPAQLEIFAEAHEKVVGDLVKGMEAKSSSDQTANITALKQGWGDNVNAYLGDAQKLHEVAFVGANLTESEQKDMNAFIGTTAYTKLLHSLGQRIPKEAAFHNGAASVFQSSASKFEQIKKDMASNPKHPVIDATHPDHEAELAKFGQLAQEAKGWV